MPTPPRPSGASNLDTLALIEHAADAIRELVHRTRHHDAIDHPADLSQLLSELTVLTGMLPQLFHQLQRWLQHEHHTAPLRTDTETDPAELVDAAVHQLAGADNCMRHVTDLLDTAHQHVAHLATA